MCFFYKKMYFLQKKCIFYKKNVFFTKTCFFIKISIFDENFDFWRNFWFLTKIWKNFDIILKLPFFIENSGFFLLPKFRQKFQFSNKDFYQKFRFLIKISILTKTSIFDRNVDVMKNFDCLTKKLHFDFLPKYCDFQTFQKAVRNLRNLF